MIDNPFDSMDEEAYDKYHVVHRREVQVEEVQKAEAELLTQEMLYGAQIFVGEVSNSEVFIYIIDPEHASVDIDDLAQGCHENLGNAREGLSDREREFFSRIQQGPLPPEKQPEPEELRGRSPVEGLLNRIGQMDGELESDSRGHAPAQDPWEKPHDSRKCPDCSGTDFTVLEEHPTNPVIECHRCEGQKVLGQSDSRRR